MHPILQFYHWLNAGAQAYFDLDSLNDLNSKDLQKAKEEIERKFIQKKRLMYFSEETKSPQGKPSSTSLEATGLETEQDRSEETKSPQGKPSSTSLEATGLETEEDRQAFNNFLDHINEHIVKEPLSLIILNSIIENMEGAELGHEEHLQELIAIEKLFKHLLKTKPESAKSFYEKNIVNLIHDENLFPIAKTLITTLVEGTLVEAQEHLQKIHDTLDNVPPQNLIFLFKSGECIANPPLLAGLIIWALQNNMPPAELIKSGLLHSYYTFWVYVEKNKILELYSLIIALDPNQGEILKHELDMTAVEYQDGTKIENNEEVPNYRESWARKFPLSGENSTADLSIVKVENYPIKLPEEHNAQAYFGLFGAPYLLALAHSYLNTQNEIFIQIFAQILSKLKNQEFKDHLSSLKDKLENLSYLKILISLLQQSLWAVQKKFVKDFITEFLQHKDFLTTTFGLLTQILFTLPLTDDTFAYVWGLLGGRIHQHTIIHQFFLFSLLIKEITDKDISDLTHKIFRQIVDHLVFIFTKDNIGIESDYVKIFIKSFSEFIKKKPEYALDLAHIEEEVIYLIKKSLDTMEVPYEKLFAFEDLTNNPRYTFIAKHFQLFLDKYPQDNFDEIVQKLVPPGPNGKELLLVAIALNTKDIKLRKDAIERSNPLTLIQEAIRTGKTEILEPFMQGKIQPSSYLTELLITEIIKQQDFSTLIYICKAEYLNCDFRKNFHALLNRPLYANNNTALHLASNNSELFEHVTKYISTTELSSDALLTTNIANLNPIHLFYLNFSNAPVADPLHANLTNLLLRLYKDNRDNTDNNPIVNSVKNCLHVLAKNNHPEANMGLALIAHLENKAEECRDYLTALQNYSGAEQTKVSLFRLFKSKTNIISALLNADLDKMPKDDPNNVRQFIIEYQVIINSMNVSIRADRDSSPQPTNL